jgi:hypothetical protein
MHRYKEYLRQEIVTDSGPQVVHLKYDVKIAKSTRILDEMKEIQSVKCTNSSLTLTLMPDLNAGLMSQEFQLGSVVAGGREWGCLSSIVGEPATAIDFTRKVRSVSTDINLHLIVLGTTDCNPFYAYEEQDIDIWSENVVTSDSNLRSKSSSRPQADLHVSDTSSTRLDLVDNEFQVGPRSTDLLSGDVFLVGSRAASATARISLSYRVELSVTFRFRIRAGTAWGVPALFEYECWINEQITLTAIARAVMSISFTQTWNREILSSFPIFALPMSVGGIGVNMGLFADLKMQMYVGLSGMFQAEVGMVVSRTRKYGSRLKQACSSLHPDGVAACVATNMDVIDEGTAVTYEKIFDWGGKVVAVVKPSLEFGLALKCGLGLGTISSQNMTTSLFEVGVEMSSGLKLSLEAKFSYGLGNLKLPPLTSSQVAAFFLSAGPEICQKLHAAEVKVEALLLWTGLSLSLQPFYSASLIGKKDVWKGNLFLACYESGGVVGKTLPYEKTGISCGVLQVGNGRSHPSTDILFGDSAQILCNAGYGLSKQRAGGSRQPNCTLYGTFSPSFECVECQPGTYSSTESSECLVCPENSISTLRSLRLVHCVCNAGFSGPNGGPCVACVAGKYKKVTGSTLCSDCPSNPNSPEWSSALTACTGNATVTSVAYTTTTTSQPTTSPQQVCCRCMNVSIRPHVCVCMFVA